MRTLGKYRRALFVRAAGRNLTVALAAGWAAAGIAALVARHWRSVGDEFALQYYERMTLLDEIAEAAEVGDIPTLPPNLACELGVEVDRYRCPACQQAGQPQAFEPTGECDLCGDGSGLRRPTDLAEVQALIEGLAEALNDHRIPIIPPGFAAMIRRRADPGRCPICRATAEPRQLSACDGSGLVDCDDTFHSGSPNTRSGTRAA